MGKGGDGFELFRLIGDDDLVEGMHLHVFERIIDEAVVRQVADLLGMDQHSGFGVVHQLGIFVTFGKQVGTVLLYSVGSAEQGLNDRLLRRGHAGFRFGSDGHVGFRRGHFDAAELDLAEPPCGISFEQERDQRGNFSNQFLG